MLLGAALMSLLTAMKWGPPPVLIGWAMVILTLAFASILLFSYPLLRLLYRLLSADSDQSGRFSLSRGDVNVGATLMYIATLLSVFIPMLLSPRAENVNNPVTFALIAISYILTLLLSGRLARAAYDLFSKEDQLNAKGNSSSPYFTSALGAQPGVSSTALPPAQSIPIADVVSRRVNTAEMLEPPSVTERTTNLLDQELKVERNLPEV